MLGHIFQWKSADNFLTLKHIDGLNEALLMSTHITCCLGERNEILRGYPLLSGVW